MNVAPASSSSISGSAGKRRKARKTRGGRLVRVLAVLMIIAGTLVLADGIVTLVWQEPISALIAQGRQHRLRSDLRVLESRPPTRVEAQALGGISGERARIAFLAGELEHESRKGAPVGRIVIPGIGADFVVVKGTGVEELKSGPGVFPETRFPGIAGTTAIAGHRTTYLAPFRHIDALVPGSQILIDMPYAHFTFVVTGQRVVSPSDVAAAVDNVGYTRLVLSACTPLFTAAKRLLVYARLKRTVPVGEARLLLGGTVAKPIEAPRPAPPRPSDPVLESLEPNRVAPVT
jgi:sortase A